MVNTAFFFRRYCAYYFRGECNKWARVDGDGGGSSSSSSNSRIQSLLREGGFRHGEMGNVEHEASVADTDGLDVAVAR